LVMHHDKFRGIEKTPAVQPTRGNKVPPILAAVRKIEIHVARSEVTVGSRDAAVRRSHALPGLSRHIDDHASLVAILRGWRACDDLHRLDRIQRNLVGKNLALL